MSNVTSQFNRIVRYGSMASDPINKDASIIRYMNYMFARTARMFKWNNLPETIPQRDLELIIQSHGYAAVMQAPGTTDLYCGYGGPAGAPSPYYQPIEFGFANPALGSATYKIGEECIIIPNDTMYQGLSAMNGRYARLLTENDISILMSEVNTRIISILNTETDSDKVAAEKFLNDIKDGKLGALLQQPMIEGLGKGIEVQQYSTHSAVNHMTQLIELEQYLKASWYNELGIQASYNMKREAINSAEAALADDALVPLIDDMLACRQDAAEKINELFGTDISVELSGIWEENDEQREIEIENLSLDATHTSDSPLTDEDEPSEEDVSAQSSSSSDSDTEEPESEPEEDTEEVSDQEEPEEEEGTEESPEEEPEESEDEQIDHLEEVLEDIQEQLDDIEDKIDDIIEDPEESEDEDDDSDE